MTESAAEPEAVITPVAAADSTGTPAAAPTEAKAERAPRRRFRRLRHYGRRLHHAGLFGALLFFLVSLMPSLLPRTWLVQGLASGISIAFGYGIGVLIAWTVRHVIRQRPSEHVRTLNRT